MTIHKCSKCGYETTFTTRLKKHMNRKKPCTVTAKSTATTAKSTATTAKSTATTAKSTATTVKSTATTVKSTATTAVIDNEKQCKHCMKIFKRKFNLSEHIKLNRCKKLKNLNLIKEDEEEIIYQDSDNDINEENNDKKELLERIIKLEEKCAEIEKKPSIINHNHVHCVILDEETIKNALQSYYDSNVFYNGPEMVIELIKNVLYKNDIKLTDISRNVFQYMIKDKDEKKVIKDIKHSKALKKIGPEYKKQTAKVVKSEMTRYDDDSARCLLISEKAQEHYDTIENKNKWANLWAESVGK
jgi:hypothetical protein